MAGPADVGTNPRDVLGGVTVLPAGSRMRRREDFTLTLRKGRRSRRHLIAVYLYRRTSEQPPRVGFVVGKVVGHAVQRNTVARRLRHIVRARLHRIPPGSLLVVRANPPAANARSFDLAQEFDIAFERTLGSRPRP